MVDDRFGRNRPSNFSVKIHSCVGLLSLQLGAVGRAIFWVKKQQQKGPYWALFQVRLYLLTQPDVFLVDGILRAWTFFFLSC